MKYLFFCLLAIMISCGAQARDLGQWEDSDPAVSKWFKELRQPDRPEASCCGEADAYWCDDIHVRDGKTYCTITDDRNNEKLKRIPVPVGTEIFIPDHKLTWKDPQGNYVGNPTGHAVVFLSIINYPDNKTEYNVYCFVQSSGG